MMVLHVFPSHNLSFAKSASTVLTINKRTVIWYTTATMATKQQNYVDRIVVDPRILVGKPVIKGTRIPVELVLKRLSQDLDMQTIFEAYPRLTEADVKACLAYA